MFFWEVLITALCTDLIRKFLKYKSFTQMKLYDKQYQNVQVHNSQTCAIEKTLYHVTHILNLWDKRILSNNHCNNNLKTSFLNKRNTDLRILSRLNTYYLFKSPNIRAKQILHTNCIQYQNLISWYLWVILTVVVLLKSPVLGLYCRVVSQ